ncbi:MAG: AccI family restriction endonuclease [Acidobacteria bacterium]|nr:AccI family restriction endonuclease [Acidobacteriota bacterium]
MHPFEIALSIPTEDIEIKFRGHTSIPWADYLLNPRRLRGSDFLMRWSQGAWSEERLVQAVNDTEGYFALPYGPSGVAPDDDPRAFELYFERLENAGLGQVKRPDLLIFNKTDKEHIERVVDYLGGASELPFTREDDPSMQELLSKALIAIECENSLWRAKKMPFYGSTLTPQKRLGGQPGLKKTGVVLPTVIIKEEDRIPLRNWQEQTGVKIHVWHVFFDLAFGLSLDRADKLISTGLIEPTVQTFQAPAGATAKKIIYKFYYHYAYSLGESTEEPKLVPAHIEDKNGHILPFVKFEGGSLELSQEALDLLEATRRK